MVRMGPWLEMLVVPTPPDRRHRGIQYEQGRSLGLHQIAHPA